MEDILSGARLSIEKNYVHDKEAEELLNPERVRFESEDAIAHEQS